MSRSGVSSRLCPLTRDSRAQSRMPPVSSVRSTGYGGLPVARKSSTCVASASQEGGAGRRRQVEQRRDGLLLAGQLRAAKVVSSTWPLRLQHRRLAAVAVLDHERQRAVREVPEPVRRRAEVPAVVRERRRRCATGCGPGRPPAVPTTTRRRRPPSRPRRLRGTCTALTPDLAAPWRGARPCTAALPARGCRKSPARRARRPGRP